MGMACGDKARRDSPEFPIIFHCHSHLLSLTFTHFLPLLRTVGREQHHYSEIRDTQEFKAQGLYKANPYAALVRSSAKHGRNAARTGTSTFFLTSGVECSLARFYLATTITALSVKTTKLTLIKNSGCTSPWFLISSTAITAVGGGRG